MAKVVHPIFLGTGCESSKFQASKVQGSSQPPAPILAQLAGFFGAWDFSGAWMLGAFRFSGATKAGGWCLFLCDEL